MAKLKDAKLKDLVFDNKNFNKHTEFGMSLIEKSLRNNGAGRSILIDKNNRIIAGNGVTEVAGQIGLDDVQIVETDGTKIIAVKRTDIDLDTKQGREMALADNATGAADLQWDADAIADVETEFDIDASAWGVDVDLEDDAEQPTASEDDFDENTDAVDTRCKKGDVWLLGNHRLMCGDSTKADDVAMLMDGANAELLFTSPPYSDIREYNGGKDLSTKHLAKFISAFAPFVKYQAVNLGMKVRDKEVEPYWNDYTNEAHKAELKMLAWNVWDKMTCGSIGMQKYFIPCRHEWIFVFGKDKKEINRTWDKKEDSLKRKRTTTARGADGKIRETTAGDVSHKLKRMESVLALWCETGEIRQQHPATFPVGLPSEYINALTNNGDNVIDCFGGSGTTLIACEQLNRKCFMMELDAHYCDVIIARWEKLTGLKAERLTDGE